MAQPSFVEFNSQPIEKYRDIMDGEFDQILKAVEQARRQFVDRTVWHVSSTALGGGVAEMLRSFLPLASGAGAENKWIVLSERPEFFGITKRIHNKLHGHAGDGGPLGQAERDAYDEILADSAHRLVELFGPDDFVFLHDPQTAGLIPAVSDAGLTTLWRCHVGVDRSNEHVEEAVEFLLPYVKQADGYVFSRKSYAWKELPSDRVFLMPPAIDAFSPKNQELEPSVVSGILGMIGLGADRPSSNPPFVRSDGSPGTVRDEAEILQMEPLPDDAFLIAQISRWDVLKDHEGLLQCFSEYLGDTDAHLALIGPASAAVADDPEGPAVGYRIFSAWKELPEDQRRRVHIVNLPMDDFDENGVMVNAIQRRADIVVQKSLVEGFGLTVSEAMWKSKPVVASAVGGIKDQIIDGESGVLIEDPRDLKAFADAFKALIADPEMARRMGEAAKERVTTEFLVIPRLVEYARLIGSLDSAAAFRKAEPDINGT